LCLIVSVLRVLTSLFLVFVTITFFFVFVSCSDVFQPVMHSD